MKKNGFTLIELLAVIVILAIIALIATPIIINIINDTREEANLRSAENYLKAAEISIMAESLNGKIDTSSCEVQSNGNLLCGTKTVTVEVENTTATGGTLTFTEGKLTNVEGLVIGPNTYNMNSNGKLVKAGPVVSYTITVNVENGTYTGDTSINENGTATVTISANTGYELPSTSKFNNSI